MSDHIYHQLREHLAYLKLGAVAEQLAAALQAAEQDKPSYTRFLHDLLQVEVTATERRRLDGRLRFASFPAHKTLEQFDFDAQPSLGRRLVSELATLRFVEERSNVLLIGPPGVGKTMLATALGLKAVNAGYRVRAFTDVDDRLGTRSSNYGCSRGGSHRTVGETWVKGALMEASERPILDLLTGFNVSAIEASSLDLDVQVLVRVAALVAIDAPPASYLINLEAGDQVGVTVEQVQGVLCTIAPIVGTARVVSAGGKMVRALGLELELAELEAEE